MSTADAAVRGGESDTPMRATYQDVLDAPANRVAEIVDDRTAILLIAGHKTDSECFYRDYVPRADAIYDEYLREIEDERRRAGARGGPKR